MLGINPYGRFLDTNLNSSAYKKGSAHLFIIVFIISTKTFLIVTFSWLLKSDYAMKASDKVAKRLRRENFMLS